MHNKTSLIIGRNFAFFYVKPNNGLEADIADFLNFLRKDKLILDAKNVKVVISGSRKNMNIQNALILNSTGPISFKGLLA